MNMQKGHVILVNEKDEWEGTMDKMQAHQEGLLHRAFSVFVMNDKNEMLLQRRALHKYHSPGLWSNACCSHPTPGESTMAGAHRRLKEEMGFDCTLKAVFDFRYCALVGNNLIENEFDHIYTGIYDDVIAINAEEVSEFKYMPLSEIEKEITEQPEKYTTWFHLLFPRFITYLQQNKQVA